VTHSFWFFAAGVKADAVPVHDNSVDMQPLKIGTYRIECSELCGIWHGSMSDNNAQIVSAADFNTWAQQQQQLDAPIMKFLPPYSHTYVPAPGAYGS
jgi:cytochrome c oxidase subunit 2